MSHLPLAVHLCAYLRLSLSITDQLCANSYIYYSCDDIPLLSLCGFSYRLYTHIIIMLVFLIYCILLSENGAFCWGGGCNGTRNLIIWVILHIRYVEYL